jgi:methyl-accepting chemotaxis protein
MILEAVVTIAPLLSQVYDEDVTVLVADMEKWIYAYNHPKLNLGIKEGDLLAQYDKTVTAQTVREKRRVVARVSQVNSMFGIPYVAIGLPLQENGTMVGALTVVISVERYDQLLTSGEEILAAVEEISASAENLAATGEELAATAREMDSSTLNVRKDVQHVSKITEEIKRVSALTNILGINASIESARAGEQGRGFAVVADEVRKLSENTKQAVNTIDSDVSNVQQSIDTLVESVNQLAEVSETQAQGVVELTKALGQITGLAQKLVEMGQTIETE